MPGLTVNTNLAKGHGSAAQTQASGGVTSQSDLSAISPGTQIDASREATRLPAVQTSQNVQTHSTTTPPRRSESPERPPMSPITPPLRATELPQRPEYTHLNQLPQTTEQLPPSEPVDFASNPDVLALQSAIAILQMQKRKAAADMVALSRAKEAALANPQAFLEDLGSGRVGHQGDRLFPQGGQKDREDSDSDDDESDEEADPNTHSKSTKPKTSIQKPPEGQAQPWHKLPAPQNVVRMPPINWSQYAVVGESLDQIHQDQLAAPSQGAPATMRADGTFHFTAGGGAINSEATALFNKQEKLVGVAAPYNPGKDNLAPKGKTPQQQQQQQMPVQQQQQQQQPQTAPAPAKR